MTKVKGKNWSAPLSSWITNEILKNDADGAVEEVGERARKCIYALSQLLQLMVDRKQLNPEDIFKIIGFFEYDSKPELIEEAE